MSPPPDRPKPPYGSVADAADGGYWYHVTCLGCRRQRYLTALDFLRAGLGEEAIHGLQHRLKCTECGHRRAAWTVNGVWTGPREAQPRDWAETVHQRFPQPTGELRDESTS